MDLFASLDPRLAGTLRADYERRRHELVEPLPAGVTIVLAGHRAAGKSTLLPAVAALAGRAAIDLDAELERRTGRKLADWVRDDEPSFRSAEREVFASLPRGVVVAVGGGFLSSHADVLRGSVTVLVPVTFETYFDRLSADTTRPRLRAGVLLDDELRDVFFEREEKHRAARPTSFVDFALRVARGRRPRRVVTLPPGTEPWAFAWKARHAGADLLEVRTDLIPAELELRPVCRALPLLVTERVAPIPSAWLQIADLVDRPREAGTATLLSFHAEAPMRTADVLALWEPTAQGVFVKHVEPIGALDDAKRLFETQHALIERFGAHCVTVLAQGPLALPFRALLAKKNVLDYLALDSTWMAADGQRFVADASREWRRPSRDGLTDRLAIVGTGIAHSRSPRVHAQPFDRVDVPFDTDLPLLLEALRPHYRGFAVTNPFKRAAAKAVHAKQTAVNTLVRSGDGWMAHNTDVEGAKAALLMLGARSGVVAVLGDGGATDAIREASRVLAVELDVRVLASALERPMPALALWTWPAEVEPPVGLSLAGCTVGVIAYGPPGRRVAQQIRALGGTPRHLGHRWFIAQARAQRALWESA